MCGRNYLFRDEQQIRGAHIRDTVCTQDMMIRRKKIVAVVVIIIVMITIIINKNNNNNNYDNQ